GLLVWIGLYEGFRIGARKSEELLAMAGLSTRPLVRASRYGGNVAPDAVLIDSSAAIDGRLRAVTTAGFLRGALLVPRFVLDELQGIADAAEPARRRRGRRGLEILDGLQGDPRVSLHVVDDGTMVVVSGAAHLVGQQISPRVTSNVQTSVGRMLFATLDPAEPANPSNSTGQEVAPAREGAERPNQ